jgi:predicted  nucleic acid-binding Zn-ribbon protein
VETLLKAAPDAPGSTASKLHELEHKLKQDVVATVRQEVEELAKASEEATAQECQGKAQAQELRFRRLESDLEELKHQNGKFEGWFQDFGKQVSESSSQVKELQNAVQQQQADVTGLRHEIGRHTEVVQQAVSSAMGGLKVDIVSQLDQRMSSQMEQITTLLASKKPRTE